MANYRVAADQCFIYDASGWAARELISKNLNALVLACGHIVEHNKNHMVDFDPGAISAEILVYNSIPSEYDSDTPLCEPGGRSSNL